MGLSTYTLTFEWYGPACFMARVGGRYHRIPFQTRCMVVSIGNLVGVVAEGIVVFFCPVTLSTFGHASLRIRQQSLFSFPAQL
jgi:hypothetical protein